MKKLLLYSLGIVLSFNVAGQQNDSWCGTDYQLELALKNNPDLAKHLHQSMLSARSFNPQKDVAALKIIPVVVHVLHDNGIGNISNAQIQNALDVLNTDYNRLNADTTNTRDTPSAPFKPNASSLEIEFKLAKIDPDGNCTSGIVRVNAPNATYNVDESSQPHKHTSMGGSDAWPRDKYFNIWVVNSIGAGGGPTFVAGYAQFPYLGSADEYGLTIMQSMMGTIETAAGQTGRVLTHEVGHCLGLLHIFQGPFFGGGTGCHTTDCAANGDYCCDTPPQAAEDFTCSQVLNSCPDIPTNDTYGFDALDQIENYMSYNSCQNMFSSDQTTIMESIFVDYAWATNLISASNVLATGVNMPDVLCQAAFSSDKTTICAGNQIQFTDESFNAVSGWAWTFSGGTPPNSTDQNPSITYSTPGLYEVTLSATDGTNSDIEIKTGYVRVLAASAQIPFLEDFEGYSTLANVDEWEIINGGSNASFELETAAGHTGSKSARLLNFGQPTGTMDEIIAAPVDLSTVTGPTLSFRYAYKRKDSGDDDWLRVYVTSDCGDSWAIRKTLHGFQLSADTDANAFVPASQSDWTTVHMTNITSGFWVNNFRYKFAFEAGGGNNFYLDNINIYDASPSDDLVVGINENPETIGLSVFPIPTNDELNVKFSLNSGQNALIRIQDLSGKIIQKKVIHANEGTNLVVLSTKDFAGGVYFINIEIAETQQTVKFIVNE